MIAIQSLAMGSALHKLRLSACSLLLLAAFTQQPLPYEFNLNSRAPAGIQDCASLFDQYSIDDQSTTYLRVEDAWEAFRNDPSLDFSELMGPIERLLEKDEIVSMTSIGGFKNHLLYQVQFKSGVKGIFKPDKASHPFYRRWFSIWNRPESEVGYYEIAKLLKFPVVPPTVFREINGMRGSVQYWVERILLPSNDPRELTSNVDMQMIYLLDYLTQNMDRAYRNTGNIRTRSGIYAVTFDHSTSLLPQVNFTVPDAVPPDLMTLFRSKTVTNQQLMNAVRTQLTDEAIESRLKGLLEPEVIQAIRSRRDSLLGSVQ